jgi:hypothetical protein
MVEHTPLTEIIMRCKLTIQAQTFPQVSAKYTLIIQTGFLDRQCLLDAAEERNDTKDLEYGLHEKGRDFALRHCFQISSGTYRNSYAMDTKPLSLGVKYTNHETDRTPASNVEVRN